MHRIFGAIVSLALLSSAAFASGGLNCEADDETLKLTVDIGVSRGMGGAFFTTKASAEVKAEGTPGDLQKLNLDDALVHHWLDGQSLKLLFYRETAADRPHAYAEITVEAVPAEEGAYAGGYTLTLFKAEAAEDEENPVRFNGKIGCFVE